MGSDSYRSRLGDFRSRMRYLALWGILASLALNGCSTTRQTRGAEQTGFLRDYSQLEKGKGKQAQWIYIDSEADFESYDKVLLEPVTIWFAPDSDLYKIPQEDLERLATYLHAALIKQLEQDYTIVNQAGPGVMRVRAAITEATGSRVVLGVISSTIPQLRMLGSIIQLGADTSLLVGSATVEAEILDSLSGERLIAAVDERSGTHVLKGSTKTWNDVEESYDYWANRLRVRLAELRGETPEE